MVLYGSPYSAECWELYCESNKAMSQETNIYSDAYQQMRSRHDPDEDKFLVLDVGTGTGRIIYALRNDLQHMGLPLSEAQFIGVDNAQPMIDRAMQHLPPTGVLGVSFVMGSALDLQKLPALEQGSRKVDLLIFGHGSIYHLHKPGQAEEFLQEVALVLRPKTGRAYISMLDMEKMGKMQDQYESANAEKTSVLFPNVYYREEYGDYSWSEGRCQFSVTFSVLERLPTRVERIIETEHAISTLRIFQDEEFVQLAARYGLRVLDKLETDLEHIFVLDLAS